MSRPLCVSSPAVSWPSAFSFTLRVSSQREYCSDAECWFLEGVSNPAPLPPQDLAVHRLLTRPLPQLFIEDVYVSRFIATGLVKPAVVSGSVLVYNFETGMHLSYEEVILIMLRFLSLSNEQCLSV